MALKIKKYKEGKKKGYIVSGYIEQRDENGNRKRIRRKFWGANAHDQAIGFRSHEEAKDKIDHARENYRATKLDEATEFIVLSLLKDLRKVEIVLIRLVRLLKY